MNRQIALVSQGATTLALSIVAVLASATPAGAATSASEGSTQQSILERGEYIVSTVGCNDCHTPFIMGPNGPEPDMSRMLSGHPESIAMPPAPTLPDGPWLAVVSGTNTAWSGPWGVSFTRNLTPDEETGLGEWTLKDFVNTIRTGKRTGRGREILPPMPIFAYKNFTDEDLEAIYTYLQSIPAISNRVPEPWDPVPTETAAQ